MRTKEEIQQKIEELQKEENTKGIDDLIENDINLLNWVLDSKEE